MMELSRLTSAVVGVNLLGGASSRAQAIDSGWVRGDNDGVVLETAVEACSTAERADIAAITLHDSQCMYTSVG